MWKAALGVVALGYAALVLGLYVTQRSLMYHPNGDRPRPNGSLADVVLIREVPSHDGLGLYSWWVPPVDETKPVIVYFHGNAGSQADREGRAALFVNRGWGILFAGYRYNAGTDGKPSEAALIADGKAVLNWLGSRGIEPECMVLFGESLGSGVTTALAAQGGTAATMVLDSPFDSAVSVAAKLYWYVPVRWLMKDTYDSLSRIGDVKVPVLIGHGGGDHIVPQAHGRRLFEAANEPKTFAFKPHAGHVDLFEYGFFDDIVAHVQSVFGPDV